MASEDNVTVKMVDEKGDYKHGDPSLTYEEGEKVCDVTYSMLFCCVTYQLLNELLWQKRFNELLQVTVKLGSLRCCVHFVWLLHSSL